MRHYLQTTESHFQKAIASPVQNPVQYASEIGRNGTNAKPATPGFSGGFRHIAKSCEKPGGWEGIRTPGRLSPTAVFKTAALDRSATHPKVARSAAFFGRTIYINQLYDTPNNSNENRQCPKVPPHGKMHGRRLGHFESETRTKRRFISFSTAT
jgi:hypothetical protein